MQTKPTPNADIATQPYKGPDPLKNAAAGALAAERVGGIGGSLAGTAIGAVFHKPVNRLIAHTPMLNKAVEGAHHMLETQKWLTNKLDVRIISAMAVGSFAGAITGRIGGLVFGASNGKNIAQEGANQFSTAQQEILRLRETLVENRAQTDSPRSNITAIEAETEALRPEATAQHHSL